MYNKLSIPAAFLVSVLSLSAPALAQNIDFKLGGDILENFASFGQIGLWLGIGGGAIIMVILVFMKTSLLIRYPVTAIVFESRRGGVIALADKARRVNEKTGEVWYELKKRKKRIRAVEYKNIFFGNVLLLFSPSSDEFHMAKLLTKRVDKLRETNTIPKDLENALAVVKRYFPELIFPRFELPDPKFKPIIDPAVQTIHAMRLEKNFVKYLQPSFWAKFGPMIILIIGILVLAISAVLIFKQVGDTNAGFQAVASALNEVAEKFERVALGIQQPPSSSLGQGSQQPPV